MKNLFKQQIADEKAFTNDIRDKIADVKASHRMVCTSIRDMESKSDKDSWKDAIYCLKKNKDRLELKLSRLTQLEDENLDGVKQLEVQSNVMDLFEEDYDMSQGLGFWVHYVCVFGYMNM